MCKSCWEEAGSPKIATEPVFKVRDAIAELYAQGECGAGGLLHVLTDDYNLRDCDVAHARKWLAEPPPWAGGYSDEAMQVQRRCLALLAPLTEAERFTAVGLYWGDWSP